MANTNNTEGGAIKVRSVLLSYMNSVMGSSVTLDDLGRDQFVTKGTTIELSADRNIFDLKEGNREWPEKTVQIAFENHLTSLIKNKEINTDANTMAVSLAVTLAFKGFSQKNGFTAIKYIDSKQATFELNSTDLLPRDFKAGWIVRAYALSVGLSVFNSVKSLTGDETYEFMVKRSVLAKNYAKMFTKTSEAAKYLWFGAEYLMTKAETHDHINALIGVHACLAANMKISAKTKSGKTKKNLGIKANKLNTLAKNADIDESKVKEWININLIDVVAVGGSLDNIISHAQDKLNMVSVQKKSDQLRRTGEGTSS